MDHIVQFQSTLAFKSVVGSRSPTLSSEDIAKLTKPLDDADVKYTLHYVEHTSECEYA
jgi:hypothetical protein